MPHDKNRMPVPSLPAGPGRIAVNVEGNAPGGVCLAHTTIHHGPHDVRDAEWRTWVAEQDEDGYRMNIMEKQCARAAWNAGWEAHEVSDRRQRRSGAARRD